MKELNNQELEREVEKTLNSWQNVPKKTLSPFFYTRIKQQLANKTEESAISWTFQGLWQPALLICFLVLNAYVLYDFQSMNEAERAASIDTFVSDYAATDDWTAYDNLED